MTEEEGLTGPMADAIRRYGQAYEDAQSLHKATTRMNGQDRLKGSRKLLEPLEIAVLDMVGGRGFTVQDLALPGGVDDKRFTTRKNILSAVNDHFATRERSDNITAMDTFYQQAYSLISSPKAKEAFNINAEDAKLRDTYGRHAAGQRFLMARRLVEAGVRFVSLTYGGWDMHTGIKAGMAGQLPQFDQAFAALITDLDQRGLLAETLVCFVSEFGRTPRINKAKGRDHWTHAYTTVFAGAGTRGGQVIGKTDKEGGYVLDQPHTPEDYASTIYEKLGIDRSKPIYMPSNRPVFFGHAGEPIAEVM
jgi:hypothetical protein